MVIETNQLKSIPYFASLNPTELETIRQAFFEKTVPRGEVIFLEGGTAETLYFVADGVVKIFKTSVQGKEQIISLVKPYEALNDIAIFDGNPSPVSAQAMSPVTLLAIKKDLLEDILQQYPHSALVITRVLAERTRQLIALVEDLSFKHVLGRVVKILLEHAGNGSGPPQRLTQQEMAAMAGTAREVVARSLKSLEEQGLIKMARHRILITDKKALMEMLAE